MRLNNQVAIVTGGASGIGEATVRLFKEEGAKLVIVDVNASRGQALAEELGAGVQFIQCDVSKEDQVEKLVTAVKDTYGRIDILFNNAGKMGPIVASDQLDLFTWEQIVNVNLTGVFLMTKHVLAVMKEQGKGSIVNNASVLGFAGQAETLCNTATKGGVANLTRTLALEYAKYQIRLNTVSPGYIKTPLVEQLAEEKKREFIARQPLGRLGEPEEVAKAVLFLASDDASFVTGANLFVDGGYMAE